MSRFSGRNHRCIQARTLPLILPMPRASYWTGNSGSPWLSVDPVFGAQCLAVYRSVRLTLLALIALLGGSRSVRAGERAERSQEIGSLTAVPLQQANAERTEQQARRQVCTRSIFSRPQVNRSVAGAAALAVDAPRRDTPQLDVKRTHAPPAGHLLTAFRTTRFDRSLPSLAAFPQPSRLSRTRLQAPGATSFLFHSRRPLTNESVAGATALAVDAPRRDALQLEVERTHAPPAEHRQSAFTNVKFGRSHPLQSPANGIFPLRASEIIFSRKTPRKSRQSTLIASDKDPIGRKLACLKIPTPQPRVRVSQFVFCDSREHLPSQSAENAGYRQFGLLCPSKPIPAQGDNSYVRC
jgi:hypothetical protein